VSVAFNEFPWDNSNLQPAQLQYSIIVPAYNERARIGNTLERILEHLQQQKWSAEVVVVDDGSRDDTPQIVRRFAAQHPQVRLLQNPGNQGKGYAVRNGMLNAKGRILLFTDADLSSPIAEAAKLFTALEKGADVAIGSRWLDPSLQFQRQSLKRQAMSRAFNLFLRAVLAVPYRDTQCGFKAFTRRAAEAIAGLSLRERGDRVPGHVLIFSVIGPCPDASRPRPLEFVSAECPAACITIRIQEAIGLLDRGQLVRADT
jgi:glycosyltransferase involved in cell wall biosynthesis